MPIAALLVLFSFLYCLFGVVLNFTESWQHVEVFLFSGGALQDGTAFSLNDLLQSFAIQKYEYSSRARFTNIFLWIVNSKIRYYLFQIIPFHPTISIGVVLSLVLSPVFVFRWIKNETENTISALTAVAFYMVSTGFLSGIQMYFHSAKPLTNLGVLYFLSEFSKIKKELVIFGVPSKKTKNKIWLLTVALCVFLFLDETAFFVFPALFVFYFMDFFRTKKLTSLIVLTAVPIATYLIFVSFFAPALVEMAGYKNYSWWAYSFGTNTGLKSLNLGDFVFSIVSFFASHFFRFHAYDPMLSTNILSVFGCLLLVFLVSFFLKKESQNVYLKLATVFIIFIIFETLILSRRLPHKPYGAYYWGALSSTILAPMAAVFINGWRHKIMNIASLVFSVFVFVQILQNSIQINTAYRQGVTYGDQNIRNDRKQLRILDEDGQISFDMVYRAWRVRENREEFLSVIKGYPRNAEWLYKEARFYFKNKQTE